MTALLRAEIIKQARRPRTYVALGLMALIPIIITFALWANPPTPSPDANGDQFFYLATQSGLLLPAAILNVMSRFLLIGVAALFAGDAIASEAAWGNLRALLVRPIRRERLLAVKLAIAAGLSLLATLIIVVTALVAGWVTWGWHGLNIGAFVPYQSVGTLLGHLAIATGYIAWSLSSIVAFGFMISTMTDSPVGAAAAAFGLYVTSSILDNISAIGVIRNGFPTHYLNAWQDLFARNVASSDMARGALLQVGYIIVFCGIGWWYFRRKDVMS
ncbi:MAG: ABC transporter permease subunit [Actinobacteria bacterium]|nr:ABC transporter permease subunit [Actinomycetota bacterium]